MGLYPRIAENYPTLLPETPEGKVFYVNSTKGSNSNSGDRREKPFATITYAIAQCEASRNDVIFVTTNVQVEAQPIVVDKEAIHIIGLPNNAPGSANQARCWIFPDEHASGGVFTLEQGDIVLRNFMLWSTAGEPCIDFSAEATAVRQTIMDCSFHRGSYGIETGPEVNKPMHYLAIIGCHFGPTLSSGGILLASDGSWSLIEDCFFESVAMPNIRMTRTTVGGRVRRCYFMLPGEGTVGGAIDLASGTRWIISENFANDPDNAAISSNPYQDGVGTSAWFQNYISNTATPTNPA